MDDIIKIKKPLEDSGVLIDGVIKTVKREIKRRSPISWSFISFNSATSDFFSGKRYK